MTQRDASNGTFDQYGAWARDGVAPTLAAGRYSLQAAGERLMPRDVAAKLALGPDDRLLDIGCGAGANLIPLSFLVERATGVDHPDVIARLGDLVRLSNVDLVGGDFVAIDIATRFNKILLYSVLHCLPSRDRAMDLLDKAVGLLSPGGRMLIGDLPNVDLKRRFLASPAGKAFDEAWRAATAAAQAGGAALAAPPAAPATVLGVDDAFVLGILARYRTGSTHAWVLPQPPDLPFGHTREDILIVRF